MNLNLHPFVAEALAAERHSELERAMARRRLITLARGRVAAPRTDVVIRDAAPSDELVLSRLAAFEGRARLCGEVLVASVRGRVQAAISVRGGDVLADPCEPTAELAALLRLRARQVRARTAR
jgi:hypothetical protein